MWPKSIVAFFFGLLLSISLMLNLNKLLPFAVDVRLLIGLLLAFCLWVGVMIYCYSCNSAKKASVDCSKVLLVSGLLNAYLLMGYSG